MTRISKMTVKSAAVLSCLLVATTAFAATDENSGRYSLKQVADGFLRLDTNTGAVSHCALKSGQWYCAAVSDDTQSLRDEINRLKNENTTMREKLTALEKAAGNSTTNKSLPDDKELDRALSFIEKVMKRFLDFARSLDNTSGQDI